MDGSDLQTDTDFEVVEFCGRLSCHRPIVQPAGRGRRKEYCSETCRRAADRDYKRAKALVEDSERNLRKFRHEVAAYGRKAEAAEGVRTPEDEDLIQRTALAAFSRAQAIVEFSGDDNDRYLGELRQLVAAVLPLVVPATARATA